MARVRNTSSGAVVAECVERATSIASRMKGLLGRAEFPRGCGLWIEPCSAIHTFFMRFSIDAVFIAAGGDVLRTYEDLKPFRLTRHVAGARSVLELPAGTLRASPVRKGERLSWETTE